MAFRRRSCHTKPGPIDGSCRFESYLVSRDRTIVPVKINAHLFELEGQNVVLSISRDIRD